MKYRLIGICIELITHLNLFCMDLSNNSLGRPTHNVRPETAHSTYNQYNDFTFNGSTFVTMAKGPKSIPSAVTEGIYSGTERVAAELTALLIIKAGEKVFHCIVPDQNSLLDEALGTEKKQHHFAKVALESLQTLQPHLSDAQLQELFFMFAAHKPDDSTVTGKIIAATKLSSQLLRLKTLQETAQEERNRENKAVLHALYQERVEQVRRQLLQILQPDNPNDNKLVFVTGAAVGLAAGLFAAHRG